jgi:hypothetical protein
MLQHHITAIMAKLDQVLDTCGDPTVETGSGDLPDVVPLLRTQLGQALLKL